MVGGDLESLAEDHPEPDSFMAVLKINLYRDNYTNTNTKCVHQIKVKLSLCYTSALAR